MCNLNEVIIPAFKKIHTKVIFSLLKTPNQVRWMHNLDIVLSDKSSELTYNDKNL